MLFKSIMTEEMMPWLPYKIFDESGHVCGISDDAPDDVKEAYEEYKKKLDEGWKL